MIKLKDLITEDKGGYDYGCAMLYFEPNNEIVEFQKNINSDDLYTADDNGGYGIETEPHCTLLYGLHEEVSLDEIQNILDTIVFGKCKIYNPSLFENEKFDVLKFDVGYPHRGGAFLHNANRMLSQLPHTTSYPDYHPHMTLAYLKPGKGKEYVEGLGEGVEFIFKPTHLVYSQPDGTKTDIPLKQNK